MLSPGENVLVQQPCRMKGGVFISLAIKLCANMLSKG